jgi:hypothetical protein
MDFHFLRWIFGTIPSGRKIVVDPGYYENLGVQYEVSDDVFHADCDRSEILLKRAYNNLQKVKKI